MNMTGTEILRELEAAYSVKTDAQEAEYYRRLSALRLGNQPLEGFLTKYDYLREQTSKIPDAYHSQNAPDSSRRKIRAVGSLHTCCYVKGEALSFRAKTAAQDLCIEEGQWRQQWQWQGH
jgi:hypothetical protein